MVAYPEPCPWHGGQKTPGMIDPADLAIPDLADDERQAFLDAASDDRSSPPGSTEADDQVADDGAGTEGSQAQGGVQGDWLRDAIKVDPSIPPGEIRIVDTQTGERLGTLTFAPDDPPPFGKPAFGEWVESHIAPADPAGLDAAIEAARHRVRIEGRWPFDVPDHVLKPAIRAAAPHLRAAALNEAADDAADAGLIGALIWSGWLRERAGRIGGGE